MNDNSSSLVSKMVEFQRRSCECEDHRPSLNPRPFRLNPMDLFLVSIYSIYTAVLEEILLTSLGKCYSSMFRPQVLTVFLGVDIIVDIALMQMIDRHRVFNMLFH